MQKQLCELLHFDDIVVHVCEKPPSSAEEFAVHYLDELLRVRQSISISH